MLLQSSKVQWGQNFSNNIKSLDHKTTKRDFPGGAVVKNTPANAGRGHGFEPWSGKIPQAAEQLSPCATTTEPVSHNDWSLHTLEPAYHNYWAHVLQLLKPACLKTVLCNKRSHRNEKPAHRKEEWPPLTTTRENPTRSNEDPTQPQNKTKQTDGEIYHVLGLEESILWKWVYYTNQSTDSMQSLSNYQWHFSQN